MRRVFLLILDSLGVGSLPDAAVFGDEGCHTLDHIVEATGGLDTPRLVALGSGQRGGRAAGAFRGRTPGRFRPHVWNVRPARTPRPGTGR